MDDIQKYFDLLGLSVNASIDEAKQAYRDQISVWHPDRFQNNPRLQTKATEKLKEINEAYEKICEYISSPKQTTQPKEEAQSDTYCPGTNHKKETQSSAGSTYTSPIYKSNGKRDIKAEMMSGAMTALNRPWYYYPLLFFFVMAVKSIFGIGKHEPKISPPAPVSATYYYNKTIQEQQAQEQLNQTQYTPSPQPIYQPLEREYNSASSKSEYDDSQRIVRAQIPEETDPEVLFKLGRKQYRGDGVPKNEAKAILYYKKAAKLGHVESAEFLKVLGVSTN